MGGGASRLRPWFTVPVMACFALAPLERELEVCVHVEPGVDVEGGDWSPRNEWIEVTLAASACQAATTAGDRRCGFCR